MGPSGGGKSTILNALAGRIPAGSRTRGSILVNGTSRKACDWIHSCGYVEQDDKIFELLTVEETITYAASFRVRNAKEDIQLKVKNIINILSLSQVSKNQMKKLSGGQRKRVMIAIELVTDPQIILLDEPTSGLDTSTANSLVKYLKQLSGKGKLVMLTIHQPSLECFSLFDDLILVSNGKIIFGDRAQLIEQKLNELGLHKRESLTLPEFLIEITNYKSSEDRENITYENVLSQLIRNHESKYESRIDINEQPSNRNIYYVEYKLDLRHICLLIKRRFYLDAKSKIGFFLKNVLLPMLIIMCINLMFVYLQRYYLKECNEIDKELVEDCHSKYKDYKESPLRNSIIGYTCLLIQCVFVGSSVRFYPEASLIKREIGVGTYSIGSYYVFLFSYQFIKNLIRSIVLIIFKLVFFEKFIVFPLALFLFLMPLVAVPLGLIAGSVFTTKKSTMIIIIIKIILIRAVSEILIYDLTSLDNDNIETVFKILCFVGCLIAPPLYLVYLALTWIYNLTEIEVNALFGSKRQ